jgi:hypothetical protein
MKKFLNNENGSALIWALFLILILCTLSFVIYSAITVYAKYQMCENELQRAAAVTADKTMVNASVRDLQLGIPDDSAVEMFEDNLLQSGWIQKDGKWLKEDGGKIHYSLEDMEIEVQDRTMKINATFAMPLPWGIGDISLVHIPMQVRASILYINQEGS